MSVRALHLYLLSAPVVKLRVREGHIMYSTPESEKKIDQEYLANCYSSFKVFFFHVERKPEWLSEHTLQYL